MTRTCTVAWLLASAGRATLTGVTSAASLGPVASAM